MVIPREASDAQKIDAGITKYIESKYYIQYSLVYWPKKAFFLSDQTSIHCPSMRSKNRV